MSSECGILLTFLHPTSTRKRLEFKACFNSTSKFERTLMDVSGFADCPNSQPSPSIRFTRGIFQAVSQRLRRNPIGNGMPVVSIKMPPPTGQSIPPRRLRHILHPPNSTTIPTTPPPPLISNPLPQAKSQPKLTSSAQKCPSRSSASCSHAPWQHRR